MAATAAFSPGKIAQIELHCTDLDAAKRFYCDSLGLRFVGQVGDSIFVQCGEVHLIVSERPIRGVGARSISTPTAACTKRPRR